MKSLWMLYLNKYQKSLVEPRICQHSFSEVSNIIRNATLPHANLVINQINLISIQKTNFPQTFVARHPPGRRFRH